MSASMYRLNTRTTLHIFYLLIFLDSGQVGYEIIRAILVRQELVQACFKQVDTVDIDN